MWCVDAMRVHYYGTRLIHYAIRDVDIDVVLCWWCYTITIRFALLYAMPMDARGGERGMVEQRNAIGFAWGVGSEESISGWAGGVVRGW
jgi:hypothetical protein